MHEPTSNKAIVEQFLLVVRAGVETERASEFMHERVTAHQVVSEEELSVPRSPQNYRDHVFEMIEEFGKFRFEITELLGDGDKVYARWKQTGRDQAGDEIIEIASAVYRLEAGKIAEYWIQIDREGLRLQRERRGVS